MSEEALAKRLEALEKEVQLLRDKEEIRDVLSRYGHYYDLGYFDDWYSLWTDDCQFGPGKGKDKIQEFFGKQQKNYLAEQHIQLALVIKVDGDTAKAIGFQVATKHSIGEFFENVLLDKRLPIGFERIGVRSWEFVRVNGKWLIKVAHTCDMINHEGVKQLLPPGW